MSERISGKSESVKFPEVELQKIVNACARGKFQGRVFNGSVSFDNSRRPDENGSGLAASELATLFLGGNRGYYSV